MLMRFILSCSRCVCGTSSRCCDRGEATCSRGRGSPEITSAMLLRGEAVSWKEIRRGSASSPRGVAIDAPGVRMGNSSSSGIGIGADIVSFLIDTDVFERLGLRNLCILIETKWSWSSMAVVDSHHLSLQLPQYMIYTLPLTTMYHSQSLQNEWLRQSYIDQQI